MANTFPGSVKTFTSKSPGQTIESAFVNDIQNEVTAVETVLLTQGWTLGNSTVNTTFAGNGTSITVGNSTVNTAITNLNIVTGNSTVNSTLVSAAAASGGAYVRMNYGLGLYTNLNHDGTNGGLTSTTQLLVYANTNMLFHTQTIERLRITTNGNIGVGTTTPDVFGKLAVSGGQLGTATSSAALMTPGSAQGEKADIALYSTFVGTGDNGVRRTADIVAGFNGGAWGNEYLALHVGNGGSANDTKTVTLEKARIDANGNLGVGTTTPAQKLDVNGSINATSIIVGQIAFPAVQSASANANTLDDYEEGTWTPTLGGTATYTTQVATYTKIGRLVHARFRLKVNTIGTGSTTTVSGLPFTAADVYGGSVSYYVSLATNVYSITAYVSGTTVVFTGQAALDANIDNGIAIWGNSAEVITDITYFV